MSRDLTEGELAWLNAHGGREQSDVEWDSGKPYVMMWKPVNGPDVVLVQEFKRERVPSRGRSQVI